LNFERASLTFLIRVTRDVLFLPVELVEFERQLVSEEVVEVEEVESAAVVFSLSFQEQMFLAQNIPEPPSVVVVEEVL
jgi:hypothetical protein